MTSLYNFLYIQNNLSPLFPISFSLLCVIVVFLAHCLNYFFHFIGCNNSLLMNHFDFFSPFSYLFVLPGEGQGPWNLVWDPPGEVRCRVVLQSS